MLNAIRRLRRYLKFPNWRSSRRARTMCGNCGRLRQGRVKAIIIISSGFNESRGKGKEREAQIKVSAKHYGMRIIGPNCLGAIRPSSD